MLITQNLLVQQNKNTVSIENDRFTIYLEGFLYIDGFVGGLESLKRYLFLIQETNIISQMAILKGQYFIHIIDKKENKSYTFIDSTGLFKVFYTNQIISSNFDDIIKYSTNNDLKINSTSIVELFHFGKNTKSNTLFNEISKITHKEIIINNGIQFQKIDKDISEIYDPIENFDLKLYFKNLTIALSESKVSLDLTGGMDTRFLAVFLNHFGLDFEVAISGYDGHPDVEIAKKVASALGKELHITYHKLDDLQNEMVDLMNIVDFSTNIFSYHRLFQLEKDRLSRGVKIAISGSGDITSDNIWLQDFPFYGVKKSNISRLYNSRFIAIEPKHEYLQNPYKKISLEYRSRILTELSKYVLKTNINTYDYIQHMFRMQDTIGRSISNSMKIINKYAPLMEIDFLRHGFHLPIHKRVFNTFQKEYITNLNKEISIIKTTENGVTASTDFKYFIPDLVKFTLDRLKRTYNQISRSMLHKNLTPPMADSNKLISFQREYIIRNKILKHLQALKILANNVDIENLEPRYYGNIISLSLFLDHYKSFKIE